MNKVKLNIKAGGIFSKFMFAIQNVNKLNIEIDELYLNNTDSRFGDEHNNPFNYVLKQNNHNIKITHNTTNLGTYSNKKPIEKSTSLKSYKKIVSKLTFTNELTELINQYTNTLNIGSDTLGVHIRLTDMNIHHKSDYGFVTIDSYINTIKKEINNVGNVFVASDNIESIGKLKDIFGNKIVYVNGLLRADKENEDILELQLKNAKDKRLWIESFLEMMLLSKCGRIICRSSNLANSAIIYSKNSKVIRV